MTHQAIVGEAMEVGQERRGQSLRSKDGTAHSKERSSYAAATGLPQLSWTLAVRDAQGEAAIVEFEPSRTEPVRVTGSVPIEWVEEVAHLMLVMENEFHKIASATLRLKYPSVTPALVQPTTVQRPKGQARAALRRKSVRPPPQKKMASASTTPVVAQRLASAS